MTTKNAVEITRKKLEQVALETTSKYGLEIHSVHFSVQESEEAKKPQFTARLCYTDTGGETINTVRE